MSEVFMRFHGASAEEGESLHAGLEEEDLSDAALEEGASVRTIELDGRRVPAGNPAAAGVYRYAPGDHPPLPPPEPPPLAPGETARLVGVSVLGDTYDGATGEVLQDAPGYDPVTRTILNNEGCDWAGRRLAEKMEALAECDRMADAELNRLAKMIDAVHHRLTKAKAPLLLDKDFLETVIRVYADGHRADILRGLRTKSRTFPSGLVVGWRRRKVGYRWREDMKPAEREAALLKWAMEQTGPAPRPLTGVGPPVVHLEAVKEYLARLNDENAGDTPAKAVAPGLEWVPEGEVLAVSVDSKGGD